MDGLGAGNGAGPGDGAWGGLGGASPTKLPGQWVCAEPVTGQGHVRKLRQDGHFAGSLPLARDSLDTPFVSLPSALRAGYRELKDILGPPAPGLLPAGTQEARALPGPPRARTGVRLSPGAAPCPMRELRGVPGVLAAAPGAASFRHKCKRIAVASAACN